VLKENQAVVSTEAVSEPYYTLMARSLQRRGWCTGLGLRLVDYLKKNLLSSDEPKSKKDNKKKKEKRKSRKGRGSSEMETVLQPSVDTTTGEMPEVCVCMCIVSPA